MVGTKQGEYIRDQLDLDNAAGPFNIELVTGDPGDNNARFFFGGAMDVLQPYIDAGKLVVKSGQTDFEPLQPLTGLLRPLSPEWSYHFRKLCRRNQAGCSAVLQRLYRTWCYQLSGS